MAFNHFVMQKCPVLAKLVLLASALY